MEIINEDGKQIGQVNPIEKAMTSGQTFNYIICKDCKSEHKNVEEWTSLCVPIPEAIPTRKVGIEFLPYSLEK